MHPSEWKKQMAAARASASRKMVFFTNALTKLVPIAAPGLGTMGVTDDWILLVDPVTITGWTTEQAAAVLLHEIAHPLRDHSGRCRSMCANAELFNRAGDREINDDLVAAKLDLPGKPLLPSQINAPNGRTAEEYYRIELELLKKQPPPPKKKKGADDGEGQSGEGQPGGEQDGEEEGKEGQGESKPGGKEPKDGQGQGSGSGDEEPKDWSEGGKQPGPGWCGSAAGRKLKHEPNGKSKDGKPIGRSQLEVQNIRRQVAEAIKEQAAKNKGNVPGGWQRWADEILKPPKIRWENELARALRGTMATVKGNCDYSRSRPSRRQGAIGWGVGKPILSGMVSPKPKVLIIGDTSGSMGTEELSMIVRESNGILQAVGTSADFAACDAKLHVLRKCKSWKQIAESLVGGGGTDFRPPFVEALKMRPKPDIIVFITDGMGPAPETPPPGIHTIWVIVGGYGKAPCEWGKHIIIESQEKAEAA